jgi:hypothetical protein
MLYHKPDVVGTWKGAPGAPGARIRRAGRCASWPGDCKSAGELGVVAGIMGLWVLASWLVRAKSHEWWPPLGGAGGWMGGTLNGAPSVGITREEAPSMGGWVMGLWRLASLLVRLVGGPRRGNFPGGSGTGAFGGERLGRGRPPGDHYGRGPVDGRLDNGTLDTRQFAGRFAPGGGGSTPADTPEGSTT